jgi:hypothetical protein
MAEAPIAQLLPMRTCGPTTANGPTLCPADHRRGRDARLRIDRCRRRDRQHQLRFRNDLSIDFGDRGHTHQRTAR